MTPEQFQRLREIFHCACEMGAAQRLDFLSSACAGDPALRSRVEALLSKDEDTAGPLGLSGMPLGQRVLAATQGCADECPEHIGKYRIIRRIGTGGMGEVFQAQQEHPRRTVALKVIRTGMESREMLGRFRHEAHILGQLHHPSIAQIYEADTARIQIDGGAVDRPFFAMEYVEGPSITAFARERNLAVRERLELIARVCDAVQHAHRRGIIHRDLKPANILVVEDDRAAQHSLFSAQPKILDFGVARAIAADVMTGTIQTSAGQLLGTLPYMSPEQVSGDPAAVDTRCDVYAIGLILFELLTGGLPYDVRSCSIPQAVRRITEAPRPRLGTVDRRLRGEIEIIVGKALEKEPSQRYQSASDLAADLRRYQTGDPIEARPHSSVYLLRKALRRHRGAAAAVVGFVLLLAVFGIVSFFQGRQNLRLAARETTARERADQKAHELDRSLYFGRIGYAQAAYHNGDIARMKSLLEACSAESRGWEWFFLKRLSDRSRRTFRDRPTPGLNAAVLDRAGRFLLTGDSEATARLRDAQTLETLLVLRPSDWIHRVALDPAGSRIALTTQAGYVAVYDRATGQRLHTLTHSDSPPRDTPVWVRSCSYSPDGRWLASGGVDGVLKLWNAASGELSAVLSRHDNHVMDVQFSPDSSQVMSAGADNVLQLWEVASGAQIRSFHGSGDHFVAIAFHPQGRQVASGGNDGCIRLWDLASGEESARWCDSRTQVTCVAFSPDGRWLACGTRDYFLRLWDLEQGWGPGAATWDTPRVLRGHRDQLRSVAFTRHPDTGHLELLSASWDGEIKWWSTPPSADIGVMSSAGESTVAPSDNGPPVHSARFSPDGRWLGAGLATGQVLFIDAATDSLAGVAAQHTGPIQCVSFSADGRRFATASMDQTVVVWDFQRREVITRSDPQGTELHSVEFGHGPDQVIAGGFDGTVRVLDLGGAQPPRLLKILQGPVTAVAVTRDGHRLIASGAEHSVKVWDLPAGQEVLSLAGHTAPVWGCALTPDETHIVSVSEDGAVKKWRLDSGHLVWTALGHQGPILDVGISPDGHRVVSGGRDRNVRLWDGASGEEILTLRGHSLFIQSVAFSADGSRIVSAGDDGTIRLWESGPGLSCPPHLDAPAP